MKIYIDMDGPLVDFYGGACQMHGRTKEITTHYNWWCRWMVAGLQGEHLEKVQGMTDEQFWKPITAAGSEFWANLPTQPWAHKLLDWAYELVGTENVYLLTVVQYVNWYETTQGKMAWALRELGIDSDHVEFCDCPSEKAKFSGEQSILIDDNDEALNAFVVKGWAIPFPLPWVGEGYQGEHNFERFIAKSSETVRLIIEGDGHLARRTTTQQTAAPQEVFDALEVEREDGSRAVDQIKAVGDAVLGKQGEGKRRLARVCLQLADTLLKKNTDYGGSVWKIPMLAQGVSVREAILVRMSDKIRRIARLQAVGTPEVDESLEDTISDLAGYCLLLLSCPAEETKEASNE